MDWAELNADLHHLIWEKLDDISYLIRFRVVCKNWRLVIDTCNHLSQLPWLLKYDPGTEGIHELEFFSVYSNRIHTIDISRSEETRILGASKQYLLMHDNIHELPVAFLNPISGFPLHITCEYLGSSPKLISVGHSPNENGDIAIIRGGWPTAFCKGRLFCSVRNKIRVINVGNGVEICIISQTRFGVNYLIETCGDILGVRQYCTGKEQHIEVYRLEDDGTDPHWVKMIDGIGDRMLFLDSQGGLCLKASDFGGFTGNCIYFLSWYANASIDDNKCFLLRYDLKTNKTRQLNFSVECCGTWFIPHLN